jgi:uncharacterized protein
MHLGGPAWISIAVGIFLTGTYGLIRGVSSALGEEIGWRGFLVPELSKTTSFTLTSLTSGIVWSLWHSGSFIFAWMGLKSGSLWTGAILHASHNLYIQAIFTPLTRNTGKTARYIDEFGCVLPLVVVVFAVYFWSKRRELPVS